MQINREQIPVPDRLDEVIKRKKWMYCAGSSG